MSVPTRAEVQSLVLERIAQEPAFRDALLADPHSALADLLGIEPPQAVRITVHEESLTDVHLVIPAVVDDVVADRDLELVSGGICWADCTIDVPDRWQGGH